MHVRIAQSMLKGIQLLLLSPLVPRRPANQPFSNSSPFSLFDRINSRHNHATGVLCSPEQEHLSRSEVFLLCDALNNSIHRAARRPK